MNYYVGTRHNLLDRACTASEAGLQKLPDALLARAVSLVIEAEIS